MRAKLIDLLAEWLRNKEPWLKYTNNDISTNLNWTTFLSEIAYKEEKAKKVLAAGNYLATQHKKEGITIYDISRKIPIPNSKNIQGSIVVLSPDFLFYSFENNVFYIDTKIKNKPISITNPEKSNNEFGSSANITEENDSYAVIGAPGTDNEKGAIYIYEKNSTWDYLGKIQPTSLKEGTRFGTSVAIIETRNKESLKSPSPSPE